MRWLYRVGQFCRHVVARPAALDEAPAVALLTPEALALFRRMPPGDRRHALTVLARLRDAGPVPVDLATAALLHDVGKGLVGPAPVWRALVVLAGKRGRGALERLASGDSRSWRYPLHVALYHPALCAELCRRAGCSPAVVRLVRLHDAPNTPDLDSQAARDLAALHAVDDIS